MKLVFATNNKHKLAEAKSIIGNDHEIVSLNDIGCNENLPETGNTIRQNASQKAMYVYEKYGVNCFADDTGLEIDALEGRPGVYSARYAGNDCDANRNIEKVLTELRDVANRKAKFRTVIALYINSEKHFFEGVVDGTILTERKGSEGFGYDPVFCPDGNNLSFAEMTASQKNAISHRGRALEKMKGFLI